jgi:hypothetical protein
VRMILHVGAHKTGSSLIQKYLRDNVAEFESRRIHYVGRGDMNGYVGWGGPVRDHPHRFRGRLTQAAQSEATTTIASHENSLGKPFSAKRPGLYPGAGRNLDALAGVLEGLDSTVVLYVRPQADFVESYYLQHLHEGGTQTFQEWIAGIDLDALSWQPLVAALRSTFGDDRVVVMDFREIRLGQDAFLARFFEAIGVDAGDGISYKPVRNPSVSEKGMRMALAVNPHLETPDQRVAVRKFLQRHFSNRKYPRPVLFDEEQRAQMSRRYDEEYEQLWRG